jgi:hypothetical protein
MLAMSRKMQSSCEIAKTMLTGLMDENAKLKRAVARTMRNMN